MGGRYLSYGSQCGEEEEEDTASRRDVQHREKGRDDCAVLRGLCATRERTIGAWGNSERPNAPPAQNSGRLRRAASQFSLSSAVRRHEHPHLVEDALAKVRRMTGPLPQTSLRTKKRRRLSTCQTEEARGKDREKRGPGLARTLNGLCFGGLFNL